MSKIEVKTQRRETHDYTEFTVVRDGVNVDHHIIRDDELEPLGQAIARAFVERHFGGIVAILDDLEEALRGLEKAAGDDDA